MASGDVSYIPGALTAVAGDQCWALVDTSPDSPAVTRIWQQLGQGVTPDALLAGLVADGLDGTAAFTLLVAGPGGQHRLFCRGTVGATVVRGAAAGGSPPGGGQTVTERFDGAGLLTWREEVVDGAMRIFLGEPPADTALRLPATSGVLLAGCVVIDLTNAASRETVSYDEGSPYEPGRPKKTIVFYPETLTISSPRSLADQAAAASLPQASPASAMPVAAGSPSSFGAAGAQAWSDTQASGALPAQAWAEAPGSAAMPAPTWPDTPGSGAMPAQAWPDTPGAGALPAQTATDGPGMTAQYQGPPPAAEPWQPLPEGAWSGGPHPGAPHPGAPLPGGAWSGGPHLGAPHPGAPLPDGAWSGGQYPGGPHPGAPLSGPAAPSGPMPARAQQVPGGMPATVVPAGPADGLIDVPPWLSGPGGAPPVGAPPVGQPSVGQPSVGQPSVGQPSVGQPQAGQMPAGQPAVSMSAGQVPTGPTPAGPPPTGLGSGATVTIEPQYQQPTPSAEPGAQDSGSTVKRSDLSDFVAMTSPPDRIVPVVPGLLCPSGHVNPPSSATCRRCGAPLPHDPVPVPRPVLGVLRLSFGDVITLDRGVLMGRNPRTDFAGTGNEERPHVVKLPSADGDISRTHLRITLDGWHVLVTDLNSTNGTLVTLPGHDSQQLRPGEPLPIQPGTVVTLAEGIDFRYEVTE